MSPAPAGRPSARILLVQDDPTVADACARALRLEGYETRVALTLGDAARLAASYAPLAALIDVRAPLSSSLDVAEQIRQQAPSAAAIAIVTGDRRPPTGVVARAAQLGILVRYTPIWLTERVALAQTLLPPGPSAAGSPIRARR